ncbi:Qat anti-phage system ATPase QatA [Methylosinus sporium]|uniref:Qat anti-phage system ATPase QatA n=1 Tax=Methylosinus sporium TaxID=428 RepID=UPI00383B9439
MADTSFSSVGYLNDRETMVDLLNNEAIARTIVKLISEKSENPITIGVHGDWGAGKSSILEMVHQSLSKDERVLCLKFNGWQFQGFEDAKIALIEKVVHGLIEKRSLLTKAKGVVEDLLKSLDWMKVAKKGGKLAASAMTGLPFLDIGDIFDTVADKVSSVVQDEDQRTKALDEIKDLKKEKTENATSTHNIPKEISAFRKTFKKLIGAADIDRLVVLIDDLDRCLPETAIETLEAVRLFVFLDKTAFVVGADERMIEYAVRRHFPNLPEGADDQNYARSYLEKLIHVPFRIPALGDTETGIYVTLLLLGAALGEDNDKFDRLLKLGRSALAKPWEGDGLKEADLKIVLGERFDELKSILITAEQISPVLSAGTKGNPRQIKRFLNTLAMRLAVADARGYGDAIEHARLAKLMLAEMFSHDAFAVIAKSAVHSQDGKSRELALLEALAAGKLSTSTVDTGDDAEHGTRTTVDPVPDDLRDVLTSWESQSDVLRWARILPNLGDTPLKPYLFVIKDRKNYFDVDAPLTQAQSALVASLTSGQIVAASAEVDLKKLTPPDIEAIFKALRIQVQALSSLEAKPPAIVGLGAMVKALPGLQERYIEILEGLPVSRLGAWAATGYDLFITSDGAKARLAKLLEKWKRDGGPLLRAALAQRDKTPARKKAER